MLQRNLGQGSSAQIGVQDYTRRIDHRAQGIAEILAKLAFHRNLEVREREVDTPIIEFSRADLAPQTLEHGANRVQRGSMAMIGRERGHSRTVHKLIHRREQTEKVFLSSFLHREIIPRTESHQASISGFVPLPKPSERMQVGQQISHLLWSEHLAVTRHVLAAMADDV
jgi:hypothetical protein